MVALVGRHCSIININFEKMKNTDIKIGQMIAFLSTDLPIEMQATVIKINKYHFEVISTLLVPFKHDGHFQYENIKKFQIIREAEKSVPLETKGKFNYLDRVLCIDRSDRKELGTIIAGFDGLAVAAIDDSDFFLVAGINTPVFTKID